MVSVKAADVRDSDVYVGVPSKAFMAGFDGFEAVNEADVPKVIDVLLIGDNNEINLRFQFRHNMR